MADLTALGAIITGARCWGIELDPQYRVLAITVEPHPLRTPGTAGEHQLLCFPTSVLLVAVTRPVVEDGRARTAVVTFALDQLTAVSERFAGATIEASPFGHPEPRPGSWGPRYSLEGRSSAADGTRATLHLDLATEDGSRLRLFARFDAAELRDTARNIIMGTSSSTNDLTAAATPGVSTSREPKGADRPGGDPQSIAESEGDGDPLRF